MVNLYCNLLCPTLPANWQTLRRAPAPRLPAVFLHHFHIRHYHAAIHGFAHVINSQKSNAGVKKIKDLQEQENRKRINPV